MDQQLLSVPDFSARIKAKYPEYKDMDDLDLAQKVAAKYPEYQSTVAWPQPQKTVAQGPTLQSPTPQQPAPQPSLWQRFQNLFIPTPEQIHEGQKNLPPDTPGGPTMEATSPGDLLINSLEAGKKAMAQTGAEVGANAAGAIVPANHPVAKGVARGVGGTVGGIVADPDTYALGALNELGVGGRIAMGAAFGVQMGKGTVDAAGNLGAIWDREDIPREQKVQMGTEAILQGIMAGVVGGHGIGEARSYYQDRLNQIPIQDRIAVKQQVESKLPNIKTPEAPGTAAPLSTEPAPDQTPIQGRANSTVLGVEEKLVSTPVSKSVQVDQYAEAQKIAQREGVGSPAIIADELNIPLSDAANHVARMQQEGILDENRNVPKPMPGTTKTPTPNLNPSKPSQDVVGSTESSQADTNFFQQAKTELGPDASISQIALRAQELKTQKASPVQSDIQADTFVSKKVGGGMEFSVEERKDLHKAQILSLQQELKGTQAPDQRADIQAAIDRHTQILTELRGGPPAVRQPYKVTSDTSSAITSLDNTRTPVETTTSPEGKEGPPVSEDRGANRSFPSTKERNIARSKELYTSEKLENLKEATAQDAKLSFNESREQLLRVQATLDLARRAQERGFNRGAKSPEEIASLEQQERDLKSQTHDAFKRMVERVSDKDIEAHISELEAPVYKQVGQAYQLHELYTHDPHAKFLRKALAESASQAGLSAETAAQLKRYFPNEEIGRRLTKGTYSQTSRIYEALGKVVKSESPTVKLLLSRKGVKITKPEMAQKVEEARDMLKQWTQFEPNDSVEIQQKNKPLVRGKLLNVRTPDASRPESQEFAVDTAKGPKHFSSDYAIVSHATGTQKFRFSKYLERMLPDTFDEAGKRIPSDSAYKYNPILHHPVSRLAPVKYEENSFFNAKVFSPIKEITKDNIKAILGGENLKLVDRLSDSQKAALESVDGPERVRLKQEFARERVANLRDTFMGRIKDTVSLIRELKDIRGIPNDHFTPLEDAVSKLREDLKAQTPEAPKLLKGETAPAGVSEEKVSGPTGTVAPSGIESTLEPKVQQALDALKGLSKKNLRALAKEAGLGKGSTLLDLAKKVAEEKGTEEELFHATPQENLKSILTDGIQPRSSGLTYLSTLRESAVGHGALGGKRPNMASLAIDKASLKDLETIPNVAGSPSLDRSTKTTIPPSAIKRIDFFTRFKGEDGPEFKYSHSQTPEEFLRAQNPNPEKPSPQAVSPSPVGPTEVSAKPLTPAEETVHSRVKEWEAYVNKFAGKQAPAALKVLQDAANETNSTRMDKYLAYERGLKTLLSGFEKNNAWGMMDAIKAVKQTEQIGTLGPSRRTLSPAEIKESYRSYAHATLNRYEGMTDLQQARMKDKINDPVLERAVKESEDPNVIQRFENLRDKVGTADPITRLGSILVDGYRMTAADVGKGILREKMGEQKLDRVQLRKLLEKASSRWDKAKIADSVDFIHAMETNDWTGFDPQDQTIGSALKDLLDNRRDKLQSLGKGFLDDYIENYFPHIWSNVGKARDVIRQTILGRRPLEGTSEFLKQREYDTFKEGLKAGLQPVTWNPVKMALVRLEQIDKFVSAHQMADSFKKEGLVKFVRIGGEVPEGYVELKDKIFSANKKDAKSGALMTFGKWYAPDDLAKAFNNHLSPGWSGAKAYDVIRNYGNAVNQANLVGGVFHLIESGFNTAVSDVALSLQQATTKGQRLSALKSTARGVLAPWSIADAYRSGGKLLAEAAEPGTFIEYARSVAATAKAGGAFQIDPQYLNLSAEKFRTNLKTAMDQDAGLQTRLRSGVKLPLNAAGTILEKANWLVMEHFVPRMKAATFHRMVDQIYDKLGPNPDDRVLRMELGKAWDSVDNRLGELIYDNLFWNRKAKDTALVTFRSTGWNLGTAREMGGGAFDLGASGVDAIRNRFGNGPKVKAELTPRSAYLIALTGSVMGIGAAMTYFATGHAPQTLSDYFYPPDGTTGPDGKPNRHYLKSYVHDINSLIQHPLETVAHKAAPLWSQAWSVLWSNADYYGTEIRHPGDSTVDQLSSVGKYLMDSSKPFFWQNFNEETRRDTPMSSKIEALFGILPAPKWAGQTKAEALAYQLALRNMPVTRDKAEFARQQEMDKLRNRYAHGHAQISDLVNEAEKGSIKFGDIKTIASEADMTPLQRHISRLTPSDAMQVYQIATPEERQQLEPQMWRKFKQIYTAADTPERTSLIEKYSSVLAKSGQPGGR